MAGCVDTNAVVNDAAGCTMQRKNLHHRVTQELLPDLSMVMLHPISASGAPKDQQSCIFHHAFRRTMFSRSKGCSTEREQADGQKMDVSQQQPLGKSILV
jgi:hypothetical protein